MGPQRVLVVDDEAPMRNDISTNLKARGYDVLMAEDGTEALKPIDEHTIDLLVLDIMVPGPDGMELLRRVRRDMDVPVVMLSARGRETDKVEALDAGADDYLSPSRSASRSCWHGYARPGGGSALPRRGRCPPTARTASRSTSAAGASVERASS